VQLSGVPHDTFVSIRGDLAVSIRGDLAKRSPKGTGSDSDADALAAVDLSKFYAATEATQIDGVQPFLRYRNEETDGDLGKALFSALCVFSPFNRLVNERLRVEVNLPDDRAP
jgi:hypothetical protein